MHKVVVNYIIEKACPHNLWYITGFAIIKQLTFVILIQFRSSY